MDPPVYRNVVQQMKMMVDVTNQSAGRSKSDIAAMPAELSTYLEDNRVECSALLRQYDRDCSMSADAETKSSTLQTEWNSFRLRSSQDLTSVSACGFAELLNKQRNRFAEIKSSQISHPLDFTSCERAMTSEETSFARVLRDCNEDILCSRPVDMWDKFYQFVLTLGNSVSVQMWEVLSRMTESKKRSGSLKQSYEELLKYRKSSSFQQEIISLGREFLESFAYSTVSNRDKTKFCDSFGLSPESYNVFLYAKQEISKYKTVTISSGSRFQGIPVWCLVFYSLRVGKVKTAADFAKMDDDEFSLNFVEFLLEYQRNHQLSPNREKELRSFYVKHSEELKSDVYKKAVIAFLSRTDSPEKFPGICTTIADWLWMKISQVMGENFDGKFSLVELQQMTREKYCNDANDVAVQFLGLILTGQFEAGIERLFRSENFRIDAVHMALVLKHKGLLLISPEIGFSSVLIPPGLKETIYSLDFVSLIKNYVRDFRKKNADTVMEYYFHFSDLPALKASHFDHEFDSIFELSVFKLAKDSKDVEKLFGSSSLVKGVIYKFLAKPERLMVEVAKDLERDGNVAGAVVMYSCIGKQDLIARLLVRELGDALLLSPNDPKRREIAEIARKSFPIRSQGSLVVGDINLRNLFVMMDLMEFFDLFDKGQYRNAVDFMEKLDLIPLKEGIVESGYQIYINRLLPEVRRCIPEILLYVANAVVKWYEEEKAKVLRYRTNGPNFSSVANLHSGGDLHKLREFFLPKIRAILAYAALLPTPQLPPLADDLWKLERSIA